MSDNRFDHIAQEILKQKQMMDTLTAENRELRRQLTDLRAGFGLFIEIAGQRFPLKGEVVVPQTVPTTTMRQQEFPAPSTPLPETVLFGAHEIEEVAPTLESTPLLEGVSQQPQEQEKEPPKTPTFLEEIMIDEFATASTSPMAVWNGPPKKQEQIDEEQKAALRRELMGSFLLE